MTEGNINKNHVNSIKITVDIQIDKKRYKTIGNAGLEEEESRRRRMYLYLSVLLVNVPVNAMNLVLPLWLPSFQDLGWFQKRGPLKKEDTAEKSF